MCVYLVIVLRQDVSPPPPATELEDDLSEAKLSVLDTLGDVRTDPPVSLLDVVWFDPEWNI